MCHKTPVVCDGHESGAQVALQALSAMCRALPASVSMGIPDALVREAAFWAGSQLTANDADSGARVTMAVVQRAKKYLNRPGAVACVSEVDKGPGETAISCPVVQWMLMHAAWPAEPHRYDVIRDRTPWDILREDVRACRENGWDRIMPLYGVNAEGELTTARIAVGYATGKRKMYKLAGPGTSVVDIPRAKVKARPIAPYTKHPMKRICNKCATAEHYALTVISEPDQCRMWTTSEWPERCASRFQALRAQAEVELDTCEIV